MLRQCAESSVWILQLLLPRAYVLGVLRSAVAAVKRGIVAATLTPWGEAISKCDADCSPPRPSVWNAYSADCSTICVFWAAHAPRSVASDTCHCLVHLPSTPSVQLALAMSRWRLQPQPYPSCGAGRPPSWLARRAPFSARVAWRPGSHVLYLRAWRAPVGAGRGPTGRVRGLQVSSATPSPLAELQAPLSICGWAELNRVVAGHASRRALPCLPSE